MIFWPFIARAITTDTQGFLLETGDTYGRLLVADPERRFVEAPEAPTSPVAASNPQSRGKATQALSGSTLSRIAACESQGNLYAKNPKSTAKGKYQFLDGSWKYYGQKLWGSEWVYKSVFSEKDQDELAQYVVSINGYTDWEASRHCWG